jgi:phospholipase/carboxylesterase
MTCLTEEIAGLRTTMIGESAADRAVIILLHGYAMTPEDLAPFGSSLGIRAAYLVPQAPETADPTGYAWWKIDSERRNSALRVGPRDLVEERPPGLPLARQRLDDYVRACRQQFRPDRLVVAGFSQGGMLACDWLLHCAGRVDALLLLSASRLNVSAWETRRERIRDLPVLVSHGQRDSDLSFEAGERLRDFVTGAGAQVTWVPFEGGHEIPLHVWRAARKFLRAVLV